MVERIGFRLVLPPGWSSVPLDDNTEAPLRELARRVASASQPANRARVEHFVREQLQSLSQQASRVGGQDLLLPTELFQGLRLPMSIVIAASPAQPSGRAQSDALLAFAGQHDDSQATEVGGVLAVRGVVDVAAKPDDSDLSRIFASRRISYVFAAPLPTHQLLMATCSIERFDYDSSGEVLESMELLFDAIIGTLRFERPKASLEVETPA